MLVHGWGTYGNGVFNPSLETRSGENILCFDEFMLEVVKTLVGEPFIPCGFDPLGAPPARRAYKTHFAFSKKP